MSNSYEFQGKKNSLWNHQRFQNFKLSEFTIQKSRNSQGQVCGVWGKCISEAQIVRSLFQMTDSTYRQLHWCASSIGSTAEEAAVPQFSSNTSQETRRGRQADWASQNGFCWLIFKIMNLLLNPWPFVQRSQLSGTQPSCHSLLGAYSPFRFWNSSLCWSSHFSALPPADPSLSISLSILKGVEGHSDTALTLPITCMFEIPTASFQTPILFCALDLNEQLPLRHG